MSEQRQVAAADAKTYTQTQGNEGLWYQVFAEGHPVLIKQHRLHRRLPSEPRCKLCYVPFKGIGGWFMRFRGKGPNSRNPNFCNACDGFLAAFPGGAEVEMSMLYVDIRNSTQYADGATAAAVSRRINAFLNTVTEVITKADGFVLAFYGDCVVAVWPPGFSGAQHAQKCLHAARKLAQLRMTDPEGQSIPVGVGVHTGKVFISTVAALQGSFRDVSIFGRNVNVTARLASNAQAFEALASVELMQAASAEVSGLESQSLQLKGIAEPVTAFGVK
jgi:adenylate cyclase